jgi:hypothetical protein
VLNTERKRLSRLVPGLPLTHHSKRETAEEMATSSPPLPLDAADESQNKRPQSFKSSDTQSDVANANEMQVESKPKKSLPPQTITPEPRLDQQPMNYQTNTPSTPGIYHPFNWEDFEARYEKALSDADNHERELMDEFDRLVKVSRSLFLLTVISSDTSQYFNVWASSSSAHDNERAVKRLQTRQRYVTLSEDRMSQKHQHCEPSPAAVTLIKS